MITTGLRLGLCAAVLAAVLALPTAGAQPVRGPVIVSREPCDPSIREGIGERQPAGYRPVVFPEIGQVPASFVWDLAVAIGSLFKGGATAPDPTYLGYKSGQLPFFFSRRGTLGPENEPDQFAPGFKGIGGRRVTDTPQLGVPGRRCPGDPYWVAFPRPGNIEIPPPFQVVRYEWDCFCRYDEEVACPTGQPPPQGNPIYLPGPNLHRVYGGVSQFIPCAQCFGIQNIRKHDYLVGENRGPHRGYPHQFPADPGYQECLRQSIESFSASGPGGGPRGPEIYGL